MAEQDNPPGDPFEDFYVSTDGTEVYAMACLPPEMMANIFEEAMLQGCQRCIFTRFIPAMGLCTADTVSTVADDTNTLYSDMDREWTWDTYIKAKVPGAPGRFYQDHDHKCIMANVIDDLYVGYTGGDPDFPVHRMDAGTWAAESQQRRDRAAMRVALAAYQEHAIPRVVHRVAMIYGQEYESVYRDLLAGDYNDEENRQSIQDGRPIAVDVAALRQLRFRPEVIPVQYQPSAVAPSTRQVHDHISILVINKPRVHPRNQRELLEDFVAVPGHLNNIAGTLPDV